MERLVSFAELTRPQEDLFKKNYCFGQLFAFSVYSARRPSDFYFKGSFKQNLDNSLRPITHSQALFSFSSSRFSAKQTFKSQKTFKTHLSFIPNTHNHMKLSIDLLQSPLEHTKILAIEHSSKNINLNTSLNSNIVYRLNATAGRPNIGIGLDFGLCLNSKVLKDFSALIWSDAQTHKTVIKYLNSGVEGDFGRVEGSVYYEPSCSLKFATILRADVKSGKYSSEIAGKWEAAEGNFQAKISDEGVVATSLRTKVSEVVTVVAAAQFNVLDFPRPHLKLGFRIKIN